MRIDQEGEEIVVRIPKLQEDYDAIGDYIGMVPNVVGVIAGSEQGLYYISALGYKDSLQLGGLAIQTYLDDIDFKKMCSDLGLEVWEYEQCRKCGNTLWGTHTLDDEGYSICVKCEV